MFDKYFLILDGDCEIELNYKTSTPLLCQAWTMTSLKFEIKILGKLSKLFFFFH